MRVLALLVAISWSSVALGLEHEAPAEKLRALEERREQVQAILGEVERRQDEALDILDHLDRDRVQAANVARQAEAQTEALNRQLAAAQDRQDAITAERVALSHDLGPRLLARYRLREGSWLQVLLAAPSIADVLWRRLMLDRLLADDLSLVTRWAAAQRDEAAATALVKERREAVARTAEVAKAKAVTAHDRDDVERGVLAGIRRKRATLKQTLEEIDAKRGELKDIVAAMPKTAGLGGFSGEKGKLPWPVPGPIEVKFGRERDRKLRTVLLHKGCDLRAAAGTPVKAPYPAMVGYAGWFSGFGNLVILDHGEGYYTLYAHLRSIAVEKGEKVTQGTNLGEVGDTGSLKGPYLYFEIRSGSMPLDPGEWLAER